LPVGDWRAKAYLKRGMPGEIPNKEYGTVKRGAPSVPCGSHPLGRNKRDVWMVAKRPYRGAHFATFPPDLIKPCILAGCPIDGIVLDPFAGSGTTGVVARSLGRNSILIEENPEYIKLIGERLTKNR
jgi:DNA modification methylase